MSKKIEVVCGIMYRSFGMECGFDKRILLAQRMLHREYPGTWEFPGGKIEPNESHHDALVRELKEELDVTILDTKHVLSIPSEDPNYLLHFRYVAGWSGNPVMIDHMGLVWVNPLDMRNYNLVAKSELIALGAFLGGPYV